MQVGESNYMHKLAATRFEKNSYILHARASSGGSSNYGSWPCTISHTCWYVSQVNAGTTRSAASDRARCRGCMCSTEGGANYTRARCRTNCQCSESVGRNEERGSGLWALGSVLQPAVHVSSTEEIYANVVHRPCGGEGHRSKAATLSTGSTGSPSTRRRRPAARIFTAAFDFAMAIRATIPYGTSLERNAAEQATWTARRTLAQPRPVSLLPVHGVFLADSLDGRRVQVQACLANAAGERMEVIARQEAPFLPATT